MNKVQGLFPVYVVEGQEHGEQDVKVQEQSWNDQVTELDSLAKVLVLIITSSITEEKLMSETQKLFGKDCKLWSVSCYQEKNKGKYETLFTEDFNVNDANPQQILEKLLKVVTENKEDATFVVIMPLSVWIGQRDDIGMDYEFVFKVVYC
jgi:hypothetical protein